MSENRWLQGVRVVDLSMGWAGPLAARNLADMGADVIKVEAIQRFDWWRGWEADEAWIEAFGHEKSASFNMVNRNKRAVTLDLERPRGKALLKELVAVSDVVVENYAAGVLTKLGLDYPVLSAVNPRVVMISMPAFGCTGPFSGARAYGSTVEQASGLPHLHGEPDDPPTMTHVALGDAVGGLNGAAALLTAIRHQRRTGQGQFIDLSQVECLLPLAAHGILAASVNAGAVPRMGNRLPDRAPAGVFPARGEDAWVVLEVQDDAVFARLAEVIGSADPNWSTLAGRQQAADAVDAWLSAWTVEHEPQSLVGRLTELGALATAVVDMGQTFADPQFVARGFWQMLDRAHTGVQPHPSPPWRARGEGPYAVRTPAPTLGQHTDEVLREVLGLEAEAIADLRKETIVGETPIVLGTTGGGKAP